VDSTHTPQQIVAGLSGVQFFQQFAQLLKTNPPLAADSQTQALNWLREFNITPGQSLDVSTLSKAQQTALTQAVAAGQAKIQNDLNTFERSGPVTPTGWIGLPADLEAFGTNFADRAGAALQGSFTLANPRSQAIYLSTLTDSTSAQLDATSNSYTLTFAAGQFPPSADFWSVTLYQNYSYLYPNPLNRYSIGNRSDYTLNADGSLTIYISHTQPANVPQGNWLPAPAAPFDLTIRIYGPLPSALDGTWVPPAVLKVSNP
jgi:hypothetical protein